MPFASLKVRVLALALFLGLAGPAAALDDADKGAIRDVITNQIEALRIDDAAGAYRFAAPGIQRMFPSQDVFMDMVKRGYAPVYRPRTVTFGEARDTELGPAQVVDLIDSGGAAWRALYTFEKQPDGSWRITGCHLVKAPGEAV